MLWAGFTELTDIKEELLSTREKLLEYESISDEIYEIKLENSRLRRMLNLRERVPYEYVPCTIISKDPDNWFRTILVNRGEDDGIRINMPVIAYHGHQKAVFGKVIETGSSISRIQPIISIDLNLGVMLQESRQAGLLSSYNYNPNLCVMAYIKKSARLNTGDNVVTSGHGGIFPQGLLVGRIIKYELNESSTFQKAIVKPALDYGKVEDVFIILKEPDPEILKFLNEID